MALNVVQTMVSILFISPGSGSDGNSTTISRIYQHLHTHAACRTVSHKISIQEFLKEASWSDVIIALHAWHSSDLLLTSHRRPYILIFGGTDLNHYSNSKLHLDRMTQVVKNSKYLVAFSPTISSIAQQLWPYIPDSRIIIIPQAIITKPNPICIFQNNLDTSKVVLLLAGIRKVKDPLFLVEAFSKWHHNNPEYKFVIMGPCKDQEFCKKVEKTIQNLPGIVSHGTVPIEDAHGLVQKSFVIVNSSLNEGMSAAILESMDLETPVVARDIPGNRDLIKHKENGLLYRTPQEFIECLELLKNDPTFYESVVKRAKLFVERNHSCKVEKTAYTHLIRTMISEQ